MTSLSTLPCTLLLCLYSAYTITHTLGQSKSYNDNGHREYHGDCNDDWSDKTNYDKDADRIYYIACVDVEWDYAPSGKNLVTGETITDNMEEATWLLGDGEELIGRKYLKALYREYTDNCFDEQRERSSREVHLGALGPNIRALTGERIKIFYKNMCQIPTSMHPHGVKYDKSSEGAPYNDQSTDGDIVEPGERWIYIWDARDTNVDAGYSSKMWLYHSHVDEVRDIYTGLFGAIIITRDGEEVDSDDDLRPKDVDREFTTFFVLYNENESHYIDENIERYLENRRHSLSQLFAEEEFEESNLMHAINGYLFGNLDTLIMKHGESVRWYTASFGNELDGPHSPHWHGNIGEERGDQTDTVTLIPGTTSTMTMDVDAQGKWLYHCHVHDHIVAGMITTYTAEESDGDYCCCGTNNVYCQFIGDRGICYKQPGCVWDTDSCQKFQPQLLF